MQGQLLGNRRLDSKVNVTNRMWFSYPGYNEILSGFADDARVTSNDKIYNENETVLEFINHQPAFAGKVAAFTSWDVFPYIINDKRSGVYVSGGEVPASKLPLTDRESLLNQMMPVIPNMLPDVRLDAFTFYYGMEYLKKYKPRVMYFAFDETDDFSHHGEYAAYLNSAHHADGYLSELYTYLQSDPEYKDKTTLIITTDHGRGNGADDWKSHGEQINGADQIWMAILGPDTPALGEVKNTQHYQNQIAQTMAALLGLRYESKNATGKILDGVMKK
jgi:predicted AlkP superfamily pyrophosphatase or phosphodiesterase